MNSALISHAPHPSPVLPKGLADLRTFAASRETLVIDTLFSPRPFAPLSKSFKSFRICTVTNSHQNPPLSNSFIFNHFQTFCKAPLSKSFRIKWLSKTGVGGAELLTFECRLSTSSLRTCLFYHLRKTTNFPQKRPNVFNHLRTNPPGSPKNHPMFSITYRPSLA
jgi:hypothetical protein